MSATEASPPWRTQDSAPHRDGDNPPLVLAGCCLIVFLTSACIMVLELAASRLIAKSVGQSLYAWASVIGVVLAGISVGSFLGGWLADRVPPQRLLGRLCFASSATCLLVYPLHHLAAETAQPQWASWPTWVLIIVAGNFLLPSTLLGTISPAAASLALARSQRPGATLGNLYACGAAGSIAGTFLAGFCLIDQFGSRHLVWMTSAALAVMGACAADGRWTFRTAALLGWLQIVVWIGLFASARGTPQPVHWSERMGVALHRAGLALGIRRDDPAEYNDESDYYFINVADRRVEGETVRALHLDHLTHAWWNPERPLALYHEHEAVYAAVTERAVRNSATFDRRRISAFFIGGGGFVFPRWIEAKFPHDPLIHVAELDPAVKLAAQRMMGLPPDDRTAIRTFIGDARNIVDDRLRENARLAREGRPPVLYDFVYGDAFNDFSVPWHLTTKEFSTKIRELLNPDGVYLVNAIDIYPRAVAPMTLPGGIADLPAALRPTAGVSRNWVPAPSPYEGFEFRESAAGEQLGSTDGGCLIGYRGVMSPEERDRVLALAANDAALCAALESLDRQSRRTRAGGFLGSCVNTAAQVFPHVYVLSGTPDGPGAARDTFVIVCALRKLDLSRPSAAGDSQGAPFAAMETQQNGERTSTGQMPALLQLARGITLTDDYAPVDNLLVPVFTAQ